MSAGGPTRVAAVIGSPIQHSQSPAIHNAAFAAAGVDAIFVALRVEPADLAAAVQGMRALGFLGASVTVPHKRAILEHCDRVDPAAERVGAVNCLGFAAGGEVIGHNTDVEGFAESVRHDLGLDVRGLRTVLLGAGGAARAAHAGLRREGAASVTLLARRPAAASWAPGGARPWNTEELCEALEGCDLLVDCTSTGLSEDAEAAVPAPVPLERLPAGAAVVSLVYHREPGLLGRARALGLKAHDGSGMLVRQAASAFALWTGLPAPVEVMRDALRRSLG